MKNKQIGFTITELLIVIVVIAVLVGIVVVAYSGMQSRGKDAERKSDIRQIAQLLEIFYQENGYYPPFQQTSVGINVAAWRASSMLNLKDELLTPPGMSSPTLVNGVAPTTSQYGYHNNGSCTGSQCTRYRLYWRSEVTGAVETHIGNTG